MTLQESGEMYLETIFVLQKSADKIRAVDVSERMGFSKPSVSRAMGLLKKGGFITVNGDGSIHLTENGLEVAKKTYERHVLLTDFFTALGVDRDTAAADACKIEHVISDETFNALKKHAMSNSGKK